MTTDSLRIEQKTDKSNAKTWPYPPFFIVLIGMLALFLLCLLGVTLKTYNDDINLAIQQFAMFILNTASNNLTSYLPLALVTLSVFFFTAWRALESFQSCKKSDTDLTLSQILFGFFYIVICVVTYSLNWSVMNRADDIIFSSFINTVLFYTVQAPVVVLVFALICIMMFSFIEDEKQ